MRSNETSDDREIARRSFLAVTATVGTALCGRPLLGSESRASDKPTSDELASDSKPARQAAAIGRKFIEWQSSVGGPDPKACPYRSQRPFDPGLLHGVAPAVKALYRLFDATGEKDFEVAADRYAAFMLATPHDPITPYSNLLEVNGVQRNLMSAAWVYGKALSPCYEWFRRHHPAEDAFELRALGIYRALQTHRRDEGYFGVGYPIGKTQDAQFSCDLGEVGSGLVGYYNVSKSPDVLRDALGLAQYFLTDYREGSGAGVWSPKLGVWLVGPWPGGGAEHFTDQVYNETGWGWSCLVVGEFLLSLRANIDDAATRDDIAKKCLSSLAWCLTNCQFEDGAHGMFGRDDKWLGMTAVPIMLYARLKEQDLVPEEFKRKHLVRLRKAWKWLLENCDPATMPEDGYVKVTGKTSKHPLENLFWQLAWVVEGLLDGAEVFKD